MSIATTAADLAGPRPGKVVVGRTFLHPAFDYLVIGGGLSLLVVGLLVWRGPAFMLEAVAPMPVFLLLTNLAHFASSTGRLYTKPNAREHYPFLTMGLPLATLIVVTLAIGFAETLGPHLQNLYLTWSPYHYAAQAYGLAVMYCYRSGASLPDRDKMLLRAACIAPFLFAFFRGPSAGVEWFAPASWLGLPAVAVTSRAVVQALGAVSLVAPVILYLRSLRRHQPLPSSACSSWPATRSGGWCCCTRTPSGWQRSFMDCSISPS